ncbi:MAG TPA: dihydroorotase family protein [Candidatus Bathyarchaeia archaeon]
MLIQSGKIARIAHKIITARDEKVNGRNLLALTGLVDAHVHLRDMGLSHKENFTTGTSAAAAGGVTTVLDMPNTQPPTDSAPRLRAKMDMARGKILVDVGFHAAAVPDERTVDKLARTGAFSLKLYLPKPISPLAVQDDATISKTMRDALRNKLLVTVHAEDKDTIDRASEKEPKSFSDLEASRPPMAEKLAVSRILRLQRQTNAWVYFCHLTLHSSLATIRNTGSRRVYTEVTPHHLLLSKRSLADRRWKAWMVPPLRSEASRRKLLSATAKGQVTVIASDHAPHTIKEKKQLLHSPPGIPGLETTLPLLLTMVNKGQIALSRVLDLTSANPARAFGLTSKGRLETGQDGDVVLVDLKKKSKIHPETFHSKAKFSPFEGVQTQGAVHTTIVRGNVVYSEGNIVARPGTGRVLEKG